MTSEEVDHLTRAVSRARRKRHRFLFCPKGSDGKPFLLITPRLSRKRLSGIRRSAKVKTLIRGTVKGTPLLFQTEHPEAGLLVRALRSRLPALVPGLRNAAVVHPEAGEVSETPAQPSAPREASTAEAVDPVPADVRAADRARAAARDAALEEPGRHRHYEASASFEIAPSGIITVVAMDRPSFRTSTRRALAERYPDEHDDEGRLYAGLDRRHELAWELMELEICHELIGRDLSEASDWLASIGYDPGSDRIADISDAAWALATDRFNDLDNLWVGDQEPNRSLGRLIPVLKRVMVEVRDGLDLRAHPISRSLRTFEIPQMTRLILDDPELLRSWFFQALVDPELADRDDTLELLTRAEAIFQRLFPKDEYTM